MSDLHAKLVVARDALGRKQRVAALDALLDAWRTCKARPIGDLVVAMGAEIDRSLSPIEGKSHKQAFEQWMSVCDKKRPIDVGRMLDRISEGNGPMIRARTKALAYWPPDPRISRKFGSLLFDAESVGVAGVARESWRWVFNALRTIGDPSVTPTLETALARIKASTLLQSHPFVRQIIREGLDKTLVDPPVEPSIEPADAALAADLAAQIAALASAPPLPLGEEKSVGATGLTDEELYAMVAESPADDAARQVLADSWLVRGDSRGEFVALQLRIAARGKASAAEKKRVNELLRTHARTLVGELANVIDMRTAVFERGRLAKCETTFVREQQRQKLSRSPLWATVREIQTEESCLFEANSLPIVEVLHCRLPLLERLWSAEVPTLRRVHVLASISDLLASPILKQLPKLPFEHLSITLSREFKNITPEVCPALLALPWILRLETLTVDSGYEHLVDAWIRAIRGAPTLPKQGLDLRRPSEQISHLRPGSRGVRFELRSGAYSDPALKRAFGAVLPDEIEEIHILEASAPLRAWLAERFPVAT
ncbi:MAG: hypothetical protein U0271_29110 [Polyangiaceae bacterium]